MTLTQRTKFNFDGKVNDTKTYILNILKQLDLNKVTNLRVLNFIAEGGFGSVSTCEYLGTEFLLKTLKIIETKAYMDEFKLTYKFRNLGIPKVIAAYEENKKTSIKKEVEIKSDDTAEKDKTEAIGVIYEYIKGMTLSSLLYKKEKGKKKRADINIPLITRLYYLIQLASTIDFLHDHQLVHRDLKPDNIIIDCYNTLKVIDFGISIKNGTTIDLLGRANSYTLKYCPVDLKYTEINGNGNDPGREFRLDEKVEVNYTITTAFDVWCVGLIICEVLSGVEPWNGKNDDKITNSIVMLDDDTTCDFEYPIPKPDKFDIEKEKTREEIIKLIKNSTCYEPRKRLTMKEVKEKLWEILTYEVKTDYQTLKAAQNKDKENFKKDTSLIVSALKTNKRTYEVVDDFVNPLISLFKNLNKKLKTDNILVNEKITEVDNGFLEIMERESSKTLTGRDYVYMTYNEFDDSITGVIFPGRRNFNKPSVVSDLYGKKNYKLKNPYCLNNKNRLYLIGGMIIDTDIKAEDDNGNQGNLGGKFRQRPNIKKNLLQNEYLDVFGSNYQKSNKIVCYNYTDNKVSTLPEMAYCRGYSSAVMYKGYIFVVGDHESIERLNITSIENSTYYTFERWETHCNLDEELYSPLLLNRNNEFLYIVTKQDYNLEIAYLMGMGKEVTYLTVNLETYIARDFQLRGFYYNLIADDTFYIFATVKENKNDENDKSEKMNKNILESGLKHYCVELSPGKGKQRKKLLLTNFNEITTESPFNAFIGKTLRKISFSNINYSENNSNPNVEVEKKELFDNSFFIHNGLEFFTFDDHLHYFTLNVIKTGIALRSFPSSTFK